MAVQAASAGATQSDDGFLDQLIASMPKSTVPPESGVGPAAPKKEVTVEDFEKLLDSTPLFMRETPKDGDDNPVLEALRSLVFEGEGDGEFVFISGICFYVECRVLIHVCFVFLPFLL